MVDRLSLEGATQSQTLFGLDAKVKWSKADRRQREKLSPVIKGFMNAPCFRKYILEYGVPPRA
ncbi:hypothetical protein N656DRAFT_783661 [Canariomyces notabilis]|uniref:Uncharacterized protein n=1 Tax=Canariomyces notabilis TaxID=2074819 RepID=A0AAN6QG45_9PEZI|nr:hypothetical protein N656DRAFT_783661 [Canariomyces arenarius]